MKDYPSDRAGIGHFLRRYGVYIVLALSLLAVGGVAVAMIGQEAPPADGESDTSVTQPSNMVEQPVTDQPDDRTSTTATSTAKPTTTTTTKSAPDLYVLPLSNTVQKPYSPDQLLFSETMQDWRVHTGTDFAGEEGQTVKALAGGTVTAVEEDLLWGGCLVIDHGIGVISRYYGVEATVQKGQKVEVGQAIGKLSAIPCESAQSPHLHLEITIDGRSVDPVAALAKEVRYAESTAE